MTRPGNRAFVLVGVLVALLLAGVVSYYASSDPDGLDRVAQDHGIASAEKDHGAEEGPLAGYQAKGIEDDRLSTLVAGVAGSLVVLGLFGGLTWVLRRRKAADAQAESADSGAGR